MPVKRSAQVIALYGSMLGTTLAGMAVSIFNTRILSPIEFSDFRIVLSALNLLAVVLPLGAFYSAGRLFAQKDRSVSDEALRGWGLAVFLLLSLFAALIVFCVAPYSSLIFERELGPTLATIAPLAGAFLMQGLLENQLQGENRILSLAFYRVAPSAAYFFLAYLSSKYVQFTTVRALLLQLGCVVSVGLIVIFMRRVSLVSLKATTATLLDHMRDYGFPVYLGALASVAVAHTGVLILGYFVHGPDAGFFALAQTMSMPLTILGSAIGTSSFKSFSSASSIPAKSMSLTLGVCVAGYLAYLAVISPVFHLFYTVHYEAALPLAKTMAIGYALHGAGDFFNRFLCAHGQGSRVRNGAFLLGAISLCSYVLLSYFAGAQGAAFAVALGSTSYLVIMILQYRKYVGR